MRVNARLDDSYQSKIDYLADVRHLTVSDVVREAIDHYFEAVRAEQVRRLRGLDSFVGMAASHDAPADLSSHYKRYVGEIIEAKHSQHGHR